ncbi:hypothetical protein ACV566_16540, partial [Staphylococcus aureus]
MGQAIMAHIVASITVFVNAPPLYLPRRYAIANARIAPMPCSFAARMAANRSCFFLHLHVLPPEGDFGRIYLGIRSITDRTNPGDRVLVIRFVRDRYARANGRRLLAQKKNSKKKIPKKATNKHNL